MTSAGTSDGTGGGATATGPTEHRAGDIGKIAQHEQAAHQTRNWVRLTYDCNDRCIFCLDSDTHDGTARHRDEIKRQILDGRRKGAQRLILSGGEPTIHPDYVDFIRLGTAAGYARVQTVTNGRMFAYREFLDKCLDAGLGEITFSIHGPNARIHDALVGVQGAFDEEVQGLRHAVEDGRPIVNIDVCVNRANVKHLAAMMRKFIAMGVREFDLLHIIPFGRAYRDHKETLFYDLEQARPHLLEAFAISREPDVHVWLNRFPVEHLEGFEHLIQDPYKLGDEVRGRQPEYAQLLDHGIPLDCRDPERCSHCYMQRVCDHLDETLAGLDETRAGLDETRAGLDAGRFEVVYADTQWEAAQPVAYGGDPASGRRLPVIGGAVPSVPRPSIAERVEHSGATRLWIRAPDVAAAVAEAARFEGLPELELELDDYDGLAQLDLGARHLRSVVARTSQQAETLLALEGPEVIVELSDATAPWLLGLTVAPHRLVIRQPTHDRLTASADSDVDLATFFESFALDVPVDGVPACISGKQPRPEPRILDTTVLTAAGHPEIYRFARRFVQTHYRVKSLRCRSCVHVSSCRGLHVNYVRARGFGSMQPVVATAHAVPSV